MQRCSLLISFLLPLLSACTQSDTSDIRKLYKARDIYFDPDVENCIVLPEVGCSGCIAGGVYFILQHKDSFSPTQKKNLVIFTAINSRKVLFRDMEIKSENEMNCILDTLNQYLTDGDNKIYPLILKLDNGKIVQAHYQSPEATEDFFEKIKL